MIEIGRLYVKIAGRDAGCKCAIVDIMDDNYVLIDGETRRRKCNIDHLEPLDSVIKITKGASHDVVKKEFEKLGLKVRDTKAKEKKERPKKLAKKDKVKEEKPKKVKKKEEKEKKKAEKKETKETDIKEEKKNNSKGKQNK